MKKRSLSLLLALTVLFGAFTMSVSAGEYYGSVSLSPDSESVQVDDTVTVDIIVNADGWTGLDMSLTYDSDKLDMTTTSADLADYFELIENEPGQVTILGFSEGGADLSLEFTALAVGTAEIEITSAKVTTTGLGDALSAERPDDPTEITITSAASEPLVRNYTKETAEVFDAVVTFEDDYQTAVVTCDKACVVMADLGDGNFVRLTAVKDTSKDNTYKFDLSGVTGDYILTVALRGDYNLDGSVSTLDVALANADIMDEIDSSALLKQVFDMSGDGIITTLDVALVNDSIVSETAIEW